MFFTYNGMVCKILMAEIELLFCPKCGTRTLEIEIGFTKAHCANCGFWFTVQIELGRGVPRKGYLMYKEEEEKPNLEPNNGKTEFQISRTNPGMKKNRNER